MSAVQIKERNQHRVTVTIRDSSGELVLPATLRWRLDCVPNSTEVLSWRSGSAASTQVIEIPASALVIITTSNMVETKRLTVQANWGTDAQINQEYEIDVLNNNFYT